MREAINIFQTETDKPRAIPMNPIVLTLMKELREQAPDASRDASVFPSNRTRSR